MDKLPKLYLFTLEVDELIVGTVYNPLPCHLTLLSRFYSPSTPNEIATLVAPIFKQTGAISLLFDKLESLGPKNIETDLIVPSEPLCNLHSKLIKELIPINPDYTNPQFIGKGWKPHVSKRVERQFEQGDKLTCTAVYLVEVEITDDNHLRYIRNKFNLKT